MKRFEVTNGEFAEWVDAMGRALGQKRGVASAPRDPSWGLIHHDGHVELKQPADWAVRRVSHRHAVSYAGWLAERVGLPIRLPTEDEWERAARGADGRAFPWGNRMRWDLTIGDRNPLFRGAGGERVPVGTATGDISPFGVHDLAGSLKEFCDGWFDKPGEHRPVRGGCYAYGNSRDFRAATRGGYRERNTGRTGIRLVRDLPE
jgi:formylglycine-generating enzyme required for sulfatase activity